MGSGAQAAQEAHEGNVRTRRTDDPDIRQGKPGRRPEPEPPRADAADAWRHAKSVFPEFLVWLKVFRDPRKRPDLATFPLDYLVLLALMMFSSQCRSRRRLGKALTGGRLAANVWRLAGKAFSEACHTDTMNNIMIGLEPEELEQLIVKMVGRLRTRKMLRRFLLGGKFVVAIDGTQLFRVNEPVGEGWLTQTKDGKTTYSRYVLAAKIVTAAGLVVPFAFEFVENPASGEFDKQDCELKACRRLMDKIHCLYPRLQIAVVGDALFAEETTLCRCEELGWDFFMTLQNDKLPTVNRQLPQPGEAWSGERKVCAAVKDHREKGVHHVRWQTPVSYHGEVYHVLHFTEYAPDGSQLYHNVWLTNVKPDAENAIELALHGRLRWKIDYADIPNMQSDGRPLYLQHPIRETAVAA